MALKFVVKVDRLLGCTLNLPELYLSIYLVKLNHLRQKNRRILFFSRLARVLASKKESQKSDPSIPACLSTKM